MLLHNYTLVFPVVLVEEAPVPLAKDLGQPFVVFRFSAIPPFGNFHYFGVGFLVPALILESDGHLKIFAGVSCVWYNWMVSLL